MNKKIGLIGLPTNSINKGCEALTFSFLEILKQLGIKEDVFVYKRICVKEILKGQYTAEMKKCDHRFDSLGYSIKFFHSRIIFKQFGITFNTPDICFDFTQGDSFTDIYGDERFNDWTNIKQYFINKKVDLILGSQTIGPFKKEENRNRAARVISGCKAVLTRDIDSFNYVKTITNRTPVLTTDVAFFLPYENTGYKRTNKIGFNPSGLLWNGGYTNDNQFGLSVDYQQFCKKCISYAIDKGFEVHLIGHVISEDLTIVDNDYCAIKALHEEFPQTIVAPLFDTPMEAKTYISNMAAFTGARMHATIASISSGVPVLPFSYSRKFEGLFKTLEYSHMIHGKEDSTKDSVEKFVKFVTDINCVIDDVLESQRIIARMKEAMLEVYKNILEG